MARKISRRQFLSIVCMAAGSTGLAQLCGCSPGQEAGRLSSAIDTSPTVTMDSPSTMPTAIHTPAPPEGMAYASSTPSSTAIPSPTAGTTDTPTLSPTSTSAPTPSDTGAPTSTTTSTPTDTATPTSEPATAPTGHRLPTSSRVVHIHSTDATFWSGQTDYWSYVDQGVVHKMVDQGMMALTETSSVANAWQALLPNYRPGQAIAIKVNLNNAFQCYDADNPIDALIQPVNGVVRGLKQIGVLEKDIWVYDAKRAIPTHFSAASQYGNVRYYGRVPCAYDEARFESNDTHAYVAFSLPSGLQPPPPIKIADVLIQSTYLINMPIMKTHGGMGITLSFKNHFGTIDHPNLLHPYDGLTGDYFRTDYSAMVDLYQNPHIVGKTILTIGDGLFAAKDNNTAPPSRWQTFGNQVPNSLFFSTDPVAIDCVMCDLLAAETTIPTTADSYLQVAADAGLGTYERGDPWNSGYSSFEYQYIRTTR